MPAEPRERRSIRLHGRDYSWPGTYFVTICTFQRKCLLGRIENGTMHENALGRLVRAHWMQIPAQFATVEIDAFVIMPNHVHGLLHLHRRVAADEDQYKMPQFAHPQVASLSWIVRAFKATVTREARKVLQRPALVVWQRNYFERVVRNGKEYADAYRYILENPRRWAEDKENLWTALPR